MDHIDRLPLKTEVGGEQQNQTKEKSLEVKIEMSLVTDVDLWKYFNIDSDTCLKAKISSFLSNNEVYEFQHIKEALEFVRFPYLIKDELLREFVYELRKSFNTTDAKNLFGEFKYSSRFYAIISVMLRGNGYDDFEELLNEDMELFPASVECRNIVNALQSIASTRNHDFSKLDDTIEALILSNENADKIRDILNGYGMDYLDNKTDAEIATYFEIDLGRVPVFRLVSEFMQKEFDSLLHFYPNFIDPYHILDSNIDVIEENIDIISSSIERESELSKISDKQKNIFYQLYFGPINKYTENKEFIDFTKRLDPSLGIWYAIKLFNILKDDLSDELIEFISSENYMNFLSQEFGYFLGFCSGNNFAIVTKILARLFEGNELQDVSIKVLYGYIGATVNRIEVLKAEEKQSKNSFAKHLIALFMLSNDNFNLLNKLRKLKSGNLSVSDLILNLINDRPNDFIRVSKLLSSKGNHLLSHIRNKGLISLYDEAEIEYKNVNNVELLNLVGLSIIANRLDLLRLSINELITNTTEINFFYIEAYLNLYYESTSDMHEFFDIKLIEIFEYADLEKSDLFDFLNQITSLPHSERDKIFLFEMYNYRLWKTYIDAYKEEGETGVISISLSRN